MSRTASPEKRAEWRRRMERFGRSCLTVADFCRSESVSIATFYYWRQQLQRSPVSQSVTPAKRPSPARHRSATGLFVPVQLTPRAEGVNEGGTCTEIACSRCSRGIEVMFPNGARLNVPTDDVAALQRSLAAIATVKLVATGDGSC